MQEEGRQMNAERSLFFLSNFICQANASKHLVNSDLIMVLDISSEEEVNITLFLAF